MIFEASLKPLEWLQNPLQNHLDICCSWY